MHAQLTRLAVAAAFAVGSPAATLGDEGAAEGRIESGTGYSEVLSKPLPVGKRIELPEGWFRVEEDGSEDEAVGSFTVVAADDEAPAQSAAVARAPEAARQGGTGSQGGAEPAPSAAPVRPTPTPAQVCRAERSAYLRQLWKENGMEVEDPDALVEGLDLRGNGVYWLASASDVFRDLAWSSDLRSRAGALIRCIHDARQAAR